LRHSPNARASTALGSLLAGINRILYKLPEYLPLSAVEQYSGSLFHAKARCGAHLPYEQLARS